MTTAREHLDSTFFSQDFSGGESSSFNHLLTVAASYAYAEEGIAVLSDLKEKYSRIFYGALGERLGIATSGSVHTVDSIWEEELLSRIPAKELEEKQLLEIRLVDFVGREGMNWILDSVLPMRDSGGEIHPVRHRIRYFQQGKSIRYALCLYNPSDSYGMAVFHDLLTGKTVPVEMVGTKGILSEREMEVLRLIDDGASSKLIADSLGISIHTVSRHRQNILSKFRAVNSAQACKIAKGLHIL